MVALACLAIGVPGCASSERLSALEARYPGLSDFEPNWATRTDRSLHDGENLIAGPSAARVAQSYVPLGGDDSFSAVMALFDELQSEVEARGWVLAPGAGSTDQEPTVAARMGKDVLRILVRSPRDEPTSFFVMLTIQDQP